MQVETGRYWIGGTQIAFRRTLRSGGKTYLCVHGVGMSSLYFLPLIRDLGESYGATAIDLPGFGGSAKPKRTWSIRQHAELLVELIRQEGLEGSVLVGHSMGCQVILEALHLDPQIADRAVLIAPTVDPSEKRLLPQALRLARDAPRERLSLLLIYAYDYLRCGPLRYLRTLRSMFAQDVEARLRSCTALTLVVAGTDDPIVPFDWASRTARILPRGELIEIPAAHAVHYAQPLKVARACRKIWA